MKKKRKKEKEIPSCSVKKEFNRNSSEKQKIITSIESTDREGKLVLGSLKNALIQAQCLLSTGPSRGRFFVEVYRNWCYQTNRTGQKRQCRGKGTICSAPRRHNGEGLQFGSSALGSIWHISSQLGIFCLPPPRVTTLPARVGFVGSFVVLQTKARSCAGVF